MNAEYRYYQGRVTRFEPASGALFVKPMNQQRLDASGYLFLKLGVRAPEPFGKLGELRLDHFVGINPGCDKIWIIGGRSVWEGDAPSKMWTSGRTFTPAPAWQPGQSESPAEYEAWLTEHIQIHEWQMKNARKWDEEIKQGDKQGRWSNHRSRPHRHERSSARTDEDQSAHVWPTSAEELQAKLLADWQAAEADAIAIAIPVDTSASTKHPAPGAPPARIPGVESKMLDDQPPPPPGSPPPSSTEHTKINTTESNAHPPKATQTSKTTKTKTIGIAATTSSDDRTTRRRARASTAAAMARFRADGDLI